ncbi:hypothetical protein B566_EDAN008403 [Ephemera danica]|nr:hypothetical protein B566_EDAN008403 [Ephemera danica]
MQHDTRRQHRSAGTSSMSSSTAVVPSTSDGDVNIDRFAEAIFNELVDDTALGVVFEIHRAARRGLLAIEDGENPDFPAAPPPGLHYPLVDAPDLDVFGQPPVKKQHECVCPSCNRNLAASRFAPHLEKCMGMGRNSSRIASRRIANSSKEGSSSGAGASGGNGNNAFVTGLLSDDEDDADWTMGGTERKRKKRDRHLGKRSKGQKVKNGGGGDGSMGATGADGLVLPAAPETLSLSSAATVPLSYDSLGTTECRSLLSQICPQHSDDQRRTIRMSLLGPHYDQNPQAVTAEGDGVEGDASVMVDVDSYEDGDGQAVRDALTRASSWDQNAEHSSTSSPADSSSTSSSSSKKPPSKAKKSKAKSMKNSTPPNGYTGVPGPEESYTANSQR